MRFEVEYKGKRARAVVNALLQDTSKKAILYGELTRLPDAPELMRLFGKILTTQPFYTRVVREPGGTERWLKEKVLPSLDRYLASHDEDAFHMAQLFMRVILDHV